jgi:hypothetical protein
MATIKKIKKAQNGKREFPEVKMTSTKNYDTKITNYPGGGSDTTTTFKPRGGAKFKFPSVSKSKVKAKKGGSFDLNKDGKTTFKDVLIGRGVLPKTAKKGMKVKKAQTGTSQLQAQAASKSASDQTRGRMTQDMKKGGKMTKTCKYGCK